jgi:hypothetical protein
MHRANRTNPDCAVLALTIPAAVRVAAMPGPGQADPGALNDPGSRDAGSSRSSWAPRF